MAHYVQDYLYAELPRKYIGRAILWNEFDELPAAEEKYFMQMALINEDTTKLFLCVKNEGKYAWVQLLGE